MDEKVIKQIEEMGYTVEYGQYNYWDSIPYVVHDDNSITTLARTYYALGSLGIDTFIPFEKAKRAIEMKMKSVGALEEYERDLEIEYNFAVKWDDFVSVPDAAELWGLSADHVKKLCRDGEVDSKKIGNSWVVSTRQKNPKIYRKEKELKETLKAIENGEVKLSSEPTYYEIEYTWGSETLIIHTVEGRDELEVFFEKENLDDPNYNYEEIVAYRMDNGEINWV